MHEAAERFGVGAGIAAVVNEDLLGKLKAPIGRSGAPFDPVPFAQPLEQAHIPNAAKIVDAVTALVKGTH